MSTITKERAELKAFITGFLSDPMHDDKSSSSLTAEVFRIALASLESEAVVSHVGSKNALDAIVSFIKSNRNPTLKDHNEVSERLFQDNCHGISNHVIEYIKRIGEELEELRSAQDSAPPAPESVTDYPETLPCPVMLEPGLRFGKGVPTRTMLGALQRRAEYYAEIEAMTPEQRAEHDAGMKEFAAMLQGADGTLIGEGTRNHPEDNLDMVDHSCDANEKGNLPVIPDWQTQAEKMAELYGSSFVLFRNGESPQCADPTKVIISFTDEGLGHGSAAPQQE
ncbi:hypothetical protein ASV20_03750 [Enterobacter roggenkampii]|uniref:hypothetical protein n=1 Tax=Enterobacter roggenkampii TaxID=1812935 RepID=UPI0007355490|nr:hypothetical protein [Enterobacter roggenkampii]KTH66046.1 hypothetical protein ASV20_03750 [Enterobacter roggenkampii]